ncbi:MAG: N-acetyltransferase [Bifidobacteriaceae bacterium]|jgi:predicted GNAT family acetyltransferase|nr:N-acetyltransferase [Bifidobacteriaceae bacterium]
MAVELKTRNNEAEQQYELEADAVPVGLAQYRLGQSGLAFVHTEIAPEVSGQGLGGVLIQAALEDARKKGLNVLPYCTFVRHYIETHPEYMDLVPPERRPAFGFPMVLEES